MTISNAAAISAPTRLPLFGFKIEEMRALGRLALPIALISLVNMGMSVTDAVMVSSLYGSDAFAAVAIGGDLYSIVFYLCAGIVGGIAPFYAAAVAEGNWAEGEKLARLGWLIVGGAAVAATPLVWTAPDWLAAAGLDNGLLEEGRGYVRAMAVTLVPMLGVALYRTLLTSAEKPRLFLQVTLTMLPLNALANYVFMTGMGPFPALGSTGAGVSSLLVASATLVVLVWLYRRVGVPRQTARPAPTWAMAVSVLRVGVPIGIATVGEVGIFLAVTLYAGRLGAADVAAHALALRVAGVAYAVPAALLQASLVRMARAESGGNRAAGQPVVAASLALSLAAGVILCIALSVGTVPLATAFFNATPASSAAAGLAAGLLVLLAAMEFVGTPGAAASGLLRGRRDARAPMAYSLTGQWAVGAPLGVFLCEVHDLGVTGLWIGLLVGTAVSSALTLLRLLVRPSRPTG